MSRVVIRIAAVLLVLAAREAAATPGPAAGRPAAISVHVLGEFNGWDTSLWLSDPGMTLEGSVWRDTVSIPPFFVDQGYQQFKLVTDRAWDAPSDFVLCPARLHEYGLLSGPVCANPSGLNLQMYADAPGRYAFALDESALRYEAALVEAFTARIVGRVVQAGTGQPLPATVTARPAGGSLPLGRAASEPGSGDFALTRLDGGAHDLEIIAPGHTSTSVTGVILAAGGAVDVGVVELSPAACTSAFTAIQVVGDFNGWNTATPSMTQVTGCVWEDTLTVPAGCHFMKFRTNNDWGNDYGTCTAEDPSCTVPPSGSTCLVSGNQALGKISFPVAGSYVFRLDESAHAYTIGMISGATAVRRLTWGNLKTLYRPPARDR